MSWAVLSAAAVPVLRVPRKKQFDRKSFCGVEKIRFKEDENDEIYITA